MNALVVVDVQNDFMPSGSLPVAHGDEVVAVANAIAPRFEIVVATQDWHPADHGSFASNHEGREVGDIVDLGGIEQVLWPDHCVQATPGAGFHSALDIARIDAVVRKGIDREIDSYSAFYDNGHQRDTGLADVLRERGVQRIVLMGLATDYCVKFSAIDAVEAGFDTVVLRDGCRAVELQPGDAVRAFDQMASAGCMVTTSGDLDL